MTFNNVTTYRKSQDGFDIFATKDERVSKDYYDVYIQKQNYGLIEHCFGIKAKNLEMLNQYTNNLWEYYISYYEKLIESEKGE